MRSRGWRLGAASALGACALAVAGPAYAANPATGTTSTGQQFNVQIDSPADGAQVPPGPLAVSGRAAVGDLDADTRVLTAMDVSGSTVQVSNRDCDGSGAVTFADDLNGDGSVGDILDCEIAGAIALNQSFGSVGGLDVGVVTFGSDSVVADVGPAAGQQSLTTPTADANAAGGPDVHQVLRSHRRGSVNLFTPFSVGQLTNFNAALTDIRTALGAGSERKAAFFLSDGEASLATGPSSPLGQAVAAGITVYTFSIGNPLGCNPGRPLRTIADQTGGTCTVVSDPTTLSAALTGLNPAGLSGVEVSTNGGTPVAATVDSVGNWQTTVSGLQPGSNTIAATGVATDGTRVTADITVLVNSPPDCAAVAPDKASLWPPNGRFHTIALGGASDPDGDATQLEVTGVTQDEPLGGAPDARLGTNPDQVELRAEREGGGDGRVYEVAYRVTDGNGGACTGAVQVGVPHDQRGAGAVDSGQTVNSLGM